MQKFTIRLTAAVAVLAFGLGAAHAQVVISQVYGGGGNAGATYKNDFIELHNNTGSAVSVDGWSVQYASSSGTSWQVTNLAGSIAPGGYYLVQENAGSGGTIDLPTPDAIGSISMSGNSGKVALVAATTALSGACPTGNLDFVGYGSANCAEGSAPTPTLSSTTAALRAGGGCVDSNNNAADFATGAPAPRNSSAAAHPCGGGGQPMLSLADVSQAEGDDGTSIFYFQLKLDRPAETGGVSFDIATSDGTAIALSDYLPVSWIDRSIPEGQLQYSFLVIVQSDRSVEPDETFFVNVSNVRGAVPDSLRATGTILNDDFNRVAIHDIQGYGNESPMVGAVVDTSGVVTAVRGNGFFLQAPDAETDTNPYTSEGIFVFVGAPPPTAAAVGNRVEVHGTVQEYVPSQDPTQPPLTEIGGGPSVTLISSGNLLPTPIVLTVDFPDPHGPYDQLERLEGMRVTADSLTVNTPTLGNVNETSAMATSNGVFHAVVTGVPRAFRQPGFPVSDPIPGGGDDYYIPRWDTNPEVIAVSSGALGGDVVDVASGCLITGHSATGPLDYAFRRYTIYPETTLQVDCDNGSRQPTPALEPTSDDISIATYNLERFFDDQNDPAIGEPVLSPTAYLGRLNKASIGIRDYLHAPDILAVQEVENLTVLQALATHINMDAVAAGQPDPHYVAYLEEGNDAGGIDIGFLIKTTEVAAGVTRVEVISVTQVGKPTTWIDPAGNTALLNDRPPLVLQSVVHFADGRNFPLTVIAVHQRSLNGAEEDNANGERVRAKRQKQAEFLANLVQARQVANPSERIVVLGDFNAFEFNDGLTDVIGTVIGVPSGDEQTVVPGDGARLVDPTLSDLISLQSPDVSYSFAFDGNVQSLDHILANSALMFDTVDLQNLAISHARINADFPATARNAYSTPTRLSDHDPTELLLRIKPPQLADLAVAANVSPTSVQPGGTAYFSVDAANAGPDEAGFAAIAFVFDQPVTPVMAPPGHWDCAPPVITSMTTITCTLRNFAAGDAQAFSLAVTAPGASAGTTLTMATSITSQTPDADTTNNADSAALTIMGVPSADLTAALSGPQQVPRSGANASYLARIGNSGPGVASKLRVTLSGDLRNERSSLRSADVRLVAPQGWQCMVQPLATFQAVCTGDTTLASGASTDFTLNVRTLGKLAQDQFTLQLSVVSFVNDPDPHNNSATLAVQIEN